MLLKLKKMYKNIFSIDMRINRKIIRAALFPTEAVE